MTWTTWMPGDFLPNSTRLPRHVFESWRDSRPEEERWQLIDGVPMMMPPPTLVHQRIAGNLVSALDQRLDVLGAGMIIAHEIGLKLPDALEFLPEPDVAVIDADIRAGQIHAGRFFLVAEILSESDKAGVIDAKLAFYQGHEAGFCVLLIEQDRFKVTVHHREPGHAWGVRKLKGADTELDVPVIGPVCRLGQLYKGTPLGKS